MNNEYLDSIVDEIVEFIKNDWIDDTDIKLGLKSCINDIANAANEQKSLIVNKLEISNIECSNVKMCLKLLVEWVEKEYVEGCNKELKNLLEECNNVLGRIKVEYKKEK